jgi:DnaK suppressor protein
MDRLQLDQFKNMITGLMEDVDRPLGRRDEIAVESTPDALDQVQRAADRELALRQLELDSSRLRGLRNALERIEDGSYGTCQRCDSEISFKRLKAVPWAAYCLQCQEFADQEGEESREELVPALMER